MVHIVNEQQVNIMTMTDATMDLRINATQDDKGIWRWNSNNRVPFEDKLRAAGLSDIEIEKHNVARDKDNNEFLKEYRNHMENHVYSDEELFEMRAAFGKGVTVVNVITGKRIKL
jgi:hypothetical protein